MGGDSHGTFFEIEVACGVFLFLWFARGKVPPKKKELRSMRQFKKRNVINGHQYVNRRYN